jgi:hypothetical protein
MFAVVLTSDPGARAGQSQRGDHHPLLDQLREGLDSGAVTPIEVSLEHPQMNVHAPGPHREARRTSTFRTLFLRAGPTSPHGGGSSPRRRAGGGANRRALPFGLAFRSRDAGTARSGLQRRELPRFVARVVTPRHAALPLERLTLNSKRRSVAQEAPLRFADGGTGGAVCWTRAVRLHAVGALRCSPRS